MACLDDSPDPNDPRFQYQNEWHTGMMGAPCANPVCFLGSLFCPQCSACYVRRQSLEEDMSRYSCCQGYYDCMCFKAGSLGESSCPDVYNLLESWLCFSCSISATRMLVMDTRDIRPDPCDARLINFSNCLQMLSCICYILSIVMEELEELALLIDFAADIFFALISSCMLAQVNLELKSQPRPANWGKQNAFPRSGSKAMAQRGQAQGGVPGQMQMR